MIALTFIAPPALAFDRAERVIIEMEIDKRDLGANENLERSIRFAKMHTHEGSHHSDHRSRNSAARQEDRPRAEYECLRSGRMDTPSFVEKWAGKFKVRKRSKTDPRLEELKRRYHLDRE
jgi:hypothetical protein